MELKKKARSYLCGNLEFYRREWMSERKLNPMFEMWIMCRMFEYFIGASWASAVKKELIFFNGEGW